MASVNKVILLGNLGRDPEVRYLGNGDPVCNMALATTRTWKDKTSGERKEETEWHRLTAIGKIAEIAGQYLKKGSQVYVEGRFKTRRWTDKDGVEKISTEVVINELTMLGDPRSKDSAPQAKPQGAHQPAPQRQAPPRQQAATAFDDMDSDIPF